MLTIPIAGRYFRIANKDWGNPVDPSFAQEKEDLGRWNTESMPCLYLNRNEQTALANLEYKYADRPYRLEELDSETGPILVIVCLPAGHALDGFTDDGVAAAGLPPTYPLDATGNTVPREECRRVGESALSDGLDGVDCRSAAPGGERELAWFPRGRKPTNEPEIRRGESQILYDDWVIGRRGVGAVQADA